MISASAAKMKTQEVIYNNQNPNYGYNCLSNSIEKAIDAGLFSITFVETNRCYLSDDTFDVIRLLTDIGYEVRTIGNSSVMGNRIFTVSWAEAE